MIIQPEFPNSSIKAPGVFFGISPNGAPPPRLPHIPHTIVIDMKSVETYFTSGVYPTEIVDQLAMPVPLIKSGELIVVVYSKYFTSTLYPFIESDQLAIRTPSIIRANLLTMPFISGDAVSIGVPLIPLASLISTIVYTSYTWLPENIGITRPAIVAGDLTTTINYTTYLWAAAGVGSVPNTDKVGISVPAIVTGNLITTISYLEAKNWPIEFVTISLPQIVAASLL